MTGIQQVDDIQNSAGTGGPGFSKGISKVSAISVSAANYTFLNTDGIETLVSTVTTGTQTLTLPSAASNSGRSIAIVRSSTGGKLTIARAGSDTIGTVGATSYDLIDIPESVVLVSDGSSKWLFAKGVAPAPMFFATKTAQTTGLTSGTPVNPVIFDSVSVLGGFLKGTVYDITTGIFTAPRAGIYLVHANITTTSTSSNSITQLDMKLISSANGTVAEDFTSSLNTIINENQRHVTALVNMAAGETIQVSAKVTTSTSTWILYGNSTIPTGAVTSFMVHQVG